jgi:hypothetical protein
MNWVDVILLAVLIGALLWGMQRGIKAQLVGLLSLGLAGLLAAWIYPDLATLLGRVLDDVSRRGRETVAFLFVLIAAYNLFHYGLRSNTTPPEESRLTRRPATGLGPELARAVHRFVLSPLNMLSRMALALVLGGIWLGMGTIALRHSLGLPWMGYDEVRVFLYRGLHDSVLVGLFDGAYGLAYGWVGPWISTGPSRLAGILMNHINQLPL